MRAIGTLPPQSLIMAPSSRESRLLAFLISSQPIRLLTRFVYFQQPSSKLEFIVTTLSATVLSRWEVLSLPNRATST